MTDYEKNVDVSYAVFSLNFSTHFLRLPVLFFLTAIQRKADSPWNYCIDIQRKTVMCKECYYFGSKLLTFFACLFSFL